MIMGLEKMIKREISITIATVLLVTTAFLMFSYAIFKVDESGETNVITFGDVAMSFCADKQCNSTIQNIGNVIGTKTTQDADGNPQTSYVPIYPQNDPTTEDEWNALDPYTFTLTNDGSLSLYVTLYLNKDTTAGLKYTYNQTINGENYMQEFTNPVSDDQIKIAIGESGNTPTVMLYSDTETDDVNGKIIGSNILLEPGQTKIFNLYAWLKSDAENASQGKYFVSQISAKGEFIPKD